MADDTQRKLTFHNNKRKAETALHMYYNATKQINELPCPSFTSIGCSKSGWPLCGPGCEAKIRHNPEVVIPNQTDGTFEIDDYNSPCYLYDCIVVLRTLLLQKTSPKKFKKIMALESHIKIRKNTESWKNCENKIIAVMKRTLGLMVFEALYPQFNFSDDFIQEISGIFDTNGIEIRLANTELIALYELCSMLEHNCCPNVKITFDENFNAIMRAGRDISEGEHLSIMYTHSLWGTHGRRQHLNNVKMFWCQCRRCEDPTELGTDLSTVVKNSKYLRQKNPLDSENPWISDDGTEEISAEQIQEDMARIGAELAILQMKGSIEDYEAFIEKYSQVLHGNHFHLITAKHSLLQMLGRTEECLIQTMPMDKLEKKEALCREMIEVLKKLDPNVIRLEIYIGVALFELHMPLLQYGKRQWEAGTMGTEDFRNSLKEPHDLLAEALEYLKDECNDELPEGQLRLQVKQTLSQLEEFMKTVGCETI